MDLATAQWLVSAAGREVLDALPAYDPDAVLGVGARLRETLSPDRAAAVTAQWHLRHRALPKFGAMARGMFFTSDGLEQSTRPEVARRHAEHLRASGATQIVDAGCGLGVDARAFTDAGLDVLSVELDPVTATFAQANVPAARVAAASAHDVLAGLDLPEWAIWLDPARRTRGVADLSGRTRRVSDLESLSPPWSQVVEWCRGAAGAGVKMSPTFARGQVPEWAGAWWVSYAGSVVETTLWSGLARPAAPRAALGIGTREWSHEAAGSPHVVAPEAAEYLYEADPAIVAAGMSDDVAALLDAASLGRDLGLATSGHRRHLPGVTTWRVLDVLPASAKPLRRALGRWDAGRVTVKRRGVPAEYDKLLRAAQGAGSTPRTLLLCPVGGKAVALLLERVEEAP